VKNTRKSTITVLLAFLLISAAVPMFLLNNAKADDADEEAANVEYEPYGNQWWRIKTDLITILFPSGKKPMFLWWYSNDTDNIYVVKYKGLIEYTTIDCQYYDVNAEANGLTLQERMVEKYAMSGPHKNRIKEMIQSRFWHWILGMHKAFLPFSACTWNLTGPVNVTRPDGVSYISFNFTLENAPPMFDFAEGNIVIRCRFYVTDAVESVYDKYNYTVKAGELKMDLVVQDWEWNIDQLDEFFQILHDEHGMTVSTLRAGLALWIDLASIKIADIPVAEVDANSMMQALPENSSTAPLEPTETNSDTSDIIAGGQRIQIRNRVANMATAINVGSHLNERFRLRFAKGSQTLAGFFDFVNTAVVIDSTTQEKSVVNVTAAYIPSGNHMRLFIGYPYFGNKTLEHDPSLGVENIVPWLPTTLLAILIGATILVAVAVAAVKVRKKTVNVVTVQ